MSNAGDKVSGLLSTVNEWRRSRLQLAVLVLCGLGEERQASANRPGRTGSGAGVWGGARAESAAKVSA
ncbi:MAG TPA: hypothetical protein VMX35_07650 [Acidobacteriota bacterium]|nr:hypothetical protein [Acidobacteriota bacterium]